MSKWKKYLKRPSPIEMRPYIQGEDLTGISVSDQDDPETDMGMIARNPDNHDDQWYIARTYFEKHYKALATTNTASKRGKCV